MPSDKRSDIQKNSALRPYETDTLLFYRLHAKEDIFPIRHDRNRDSGWDAATLPCNHFYLFEGLVFAHIEHL